MDERLVCHYEYVINTKYVLLFLIYASLVFFVSSSTSYLLSFLGIPCVVHSLTLNAEAKWCMSTLLPAPIHFDECEGLLLFLPFSPNLVSMYPFLGYGIKNKERIIPGTINEMGDEVM
jgi:hypothetical protein